MAEEIEPVTILASWGGDEEAGFREVLDAFTAKTGIPYKYEGSRNVTVLLKSRVAGGNPPDVAMLPRPGEMAEFARQGAILPLDGVRGDEILPPDILTDNYSQAWVDLGTVDGLFYGLTVKANSKSTFWYKPASFEALGVEPPETWDELLAIADAYLVFVDKMAELHLGTAGEYLVMAATLVYLKSLELLPRKPTPLDPEDEIEDPREALARRLIEYQRYRDAAEQLEQRTVLGRRRRRKKRSAASTAPSMSAAIGMPVSMRLDRQGEAASPATSSRPSTAAISRTPCLSMPAST